jgi:hypothetical protein
MSVSDTDPHGFDENRNRIAEVAGKFVPQWLARRSLAVEIETDDDRYQPNEVVKFTVAITNRLPLPVVVTTPQRQLWNWTVDGEPEASDERRYVGDSNGRFSFRARERKVVTVTWSGRFKRVGERTTWETPVSGAHEISAFVATEPPRASDTVEIWIE